MSRKKPKNLRERYRLVQTVSRDYLMERVVVDGAEHFELTVTGIGDAVIERGTIFNTRATADTGLLDRVCTI